MRAGEQLRFAEHAKLFVSAPRPSSAPFGGTFPEGKVKGCLRFAAASGIRQPVLTYSLFTLHYSLFPILPLRRMTCLLRSGAEIEGDDDHVDGHKILRDPACDGHVGKRACQHQRYKALDPQKARRGPRRLFLRRRRLPGALRLPLRPGRVSSVSSRKSVRVCAVYVTLVTSRPTVVSIRFSASSMVCRRFRFMFPSPFCALYHVPLYTPAKSSRRILCVLPLSRW